MEFTFQFPKWKNPVISPWILLIHEHDFSPTFTLSQEHAKKGSSHSAAGSYDEQVLSRGMIGHYSITPPLQYSRFLMA